MRAAVLVWAAWLGAAVRAEEACGGLFNSSARGVIHTPNFPRPFPVPIRCRWIILTNSPSPSIVVYLTQVYVTSGLSVTEYSYYESESYNYGRKVVHRVTDQNVTETKWLWSGYPALIIDFQLDALEGHHLRVLDTLLDVYGFNITFEVGAPVHAHTCNALECSFNGDCVAVADFSQYECICRPSFWGSHCGFGPLCNLQQNTCHNGATCRHVGSVSFSCLCPPGFSGTLCEQPQPVISGCASDDCVLQCPYDAGNQQCSCGVPHRIVKEKAHYEVTVRIANLTALRETYSSSVELVLRSRMEKYLRNNNISYLEDLQVNITPAAEVVFHFFGGKADGRKVREAMNRLVERGRLSDVPLVHTALAFRQEPTLLLQEVKVNQKNPIRENEEFIVSCIAQGSSHMTFMWFKDGVLVNHSKSVRNMWTKLIPMGSEDQYNAMLGIERANALDAGWYTCQVVDLEVQQCKSVYVEVLSQPQVNISPMSVTVERGEDVTVKCMSTSSYQRHEKYGYNWTKNKALFPMMRNKIIWEDLYPSGSILKIFKAQKSAIFDCQVQGSVASNTASVSVEVVNKSVVAVCAAEASLGVWWGAAAPGQLSAVPCPPTHQGRAATRRCVLTDTHTASWQRPDFSQCRRPALAHIHKKFILLTLGYQNTTGAETLADTLALLRKVTRLLPGEGEQVLDLLHDVQSYLNQTDSLDEILASVNDFYEIISILLDNPFSVQNPEKIVQLQELVNQESIIWGSFLIPMKTYKLQLSSIELIVSPFKTTSLTGKTFQKHFSSTSTTLINKMTIYIDALKRRGYLNGTYCIAVIVYKNLTRFLPARYSCKLGDGTEMEYEINSHVVTVQLGQGRSMLYPSPGTFQVDLEMEPIFKEYNPLRWKSTCAVTNVARVEHSWNIEGCKTHNGANNISNCRCYNTGSFAVLMTSHNAVPGSPPAIKQHLIPLVGCIVCLLQTMMTLVLLLPHWWYHQNCLVFLKLQCSLAVVAAMITFVYIFQGSVGKEFFPYVTTSLEAFMLIGNSSHISKLLIVYTEVVKIPKVKHLKQTVICIITGVPVLALLCSHLVHHSTEWNLNSWWLIIGSTTFNIFITSVTIMLLLFAFLYFMVTRKLSNYSRERHSGAKSVKYRTGLLKRAGIIFLMMVLVEIASILYINLQTVACHYVFSVATSLLGFSVLVCYIISSECPLHTKLLHKLKLVKTEDVDFSSDSLNSPLRFFMKQDADLESTAAPHHRGSDLQDGACERAGEDDGLLVLEERQHRTVTTEGDPSTVETYMTDEEVDLEGYSSSPHRHTHCRFVSSPQQEPTVCYINKTSTTTEVKIHVEVDTTVHENETIPEKSDISEDRKQEEPYSEQSVEHSENVMDRISHDLDYLLNRWPQDHRVSRFSITSTIQEEDEEDENLQV